MYVPYDVQLAYGWTKLTLKVNLIAILVVVPAILIVAPRFGAVGAAWAWLVLNLGYLVIAAQRMFLRILPDQKRLWYAEDLLMLIACSSMTAFLIRLALPIPSNAAQQVLFLVTSSLLIFVSSALAASQLRQPIFAQTRFFLKNDKIATAKIIIPS